MPVFPQPGDRIKISWDNGAVYEAWVSNVDMKGLRDPVFAGLYYDDGTFERVDLRNESWKMARRNPVGGATGL